MNTLTDPLKRIVRDLVDKKLWPVAVALLVAIVAVPVLLGGSAEDAPPPAALAATPVEAPTSNSLVTVADEAVDGKDTRAGRIDDPFYDPPAPPAPPAAVAGPDAGSSATAGAPTGGGTPAGAGGRPSETTPAQPAELVSAPTYYSTVVRWWETKPGKPQPIRRLTPFGGLANTAVLYLGVTKSNGNYAVFLLGPNATSDGEARCEDAGCRVFGLKTGQTQLVTVQPADGGEARQYNLNVSSVKSHTADAATAKTMRHRVHPDGRDVLSVMRDDQLTADAAKPIRFDYDSGLLVKSGGGATAAAPAAPAAE
ncbi:hypothetical protein BH20ACT16_BH20ACT16_01820 [soil metagenome]